MYLYMMFSKYITTYKIARSDIYHENYQIGDMNQEEKVIYQSSKHESIINHYVESMQ